MDKNSSLGTLYLNWLENEDIPDSKYVNQHEAVKVISGGCSTLHPILLLVEDICVSLIKN